MGYEVKRRPGSLAGVWIDVGAHHGETTFEFARRNRDLKVFAFEANWAMARDVMGVLPNFIVLPMAVSEEDGLAEFRINTNDGSSSLLPMSEAGKAQWPDQDYTVTETVRVPTIRLDTFMALAGITTVEYLKIDAEGADLAVLRSAGDRLADVRRVMVEVDLLEDRLYEGAPSRDEMVEFMVAHGFVLRAGVRQNQDRQENLTFERA